jgi:hypothetical protein
LAQLQALSCDYGQGYLFSKPASATAIAKLLAEAQVCPRKASRPELFAVRSELVA